MEFLDLQTDGMDAIKKQKPQYDFPTVVFKKEKNCTAYFNRYAKEIFNNCTYIKVCANAEYIVFQPSNKEDYYSHRISYNKSGGCSFNCAGLDRFILDGKAFKLYAVKKGFAIKVNDPIKNRK